MGTLILILTAAAVWAWAVAHQLMIGWVLSVLIERLPPPIPTTGAFYRYFYSVLQFFVANTKRSQDAVTSPKP